MESIDRDELTRTVLESFEKAKNSLCTADYPAHKKTQDVISNNIPCYDIHEFERGSFVLDRFISLFADMRGSTKRISKIGMTKTYLTMHAIIPMMIYIVEQSNGNIVDIPGDGVMALFRVNETYDVSLGKPENNSETIAVKAAMEFLKALEEIVNPLLLDNKIPPVEFGIGIDTGKVIVTKIGTRRIADLKIIGDSVNNAAKHSKGKNEVFISKAVYQKIPLSLQEDFKNDVENEWYFASLRKRETV